MSLITRCPACETMFKVVADQLKISQGWVRCGQCSEVFDAAAQLQPRVAGAAAPAPAPEAALPQASDTAEAVVPLATLLVAPESTDAVPSLPEPLWPAAPAPAPSVPEVQVSMPADLAAEVFASSVNPDPFEFPAAAPVRARAESGFGESESPAQDSGVDEVSFVRKARREAFWRRPVMRLGLGLVGLLLLLVLLAQVAVVQRNTLAMAQPGLVPALQALCSLARCDITPPQHIESIVIDSSSFNKLAADAYRLKVVIKNTGSLPLAMPSLELTLTDTQEHALLRRILGPADMGATAATLAAGTEFTAVVTVQIPEAAPDGDAAASSPPITGSPLRIAGYRVLAFYP